MIVIIVIVIIVTVIFCHDDHVRLLVSMDEGFFDNLILMSEAVHIWRIRNLNTYANLADESLLR